MTTKNDDTLETILYDVVECEVNRGQPIRFFCHFLGQHDIRICPTCRQPEKYMVAENVTNMSMANMLPQGQEFVCKQLTVTGIPKESEASVYALLQIGVKTWEAAPVDLLQQSKFESKRVIDGLRTFFVELQPQATLGRLRIRIELRGELRRSAS